MFFTEVTLKRDGWYNKVFRFVFPGAPVFQNFCPFFWLTILALFLLPFKAIWRGLTRLGKGLVALAALLYDFTDKHIIVYFLSSTYHKYTAEDFAVAKALWDEDRWGYGIANCEEKKYIKLWRWVMDHSYHLSKERKEDPYADAGKIDPAQVAKMLAELREKWRREAGEREKRRSERFEKEERIREKILSVKKFNYGPLIQLGKILGYVFGVVILLILIPIVLVGIWHLILFLGWLWYWAWVGIWYMGRWNWAGIFSILFLAAVTTVAIVGMLVIVTKVSNCPRCRERLCRMGENLIYALEKFVYIIDKLLLPLRYIIGGVFAFFSFLWKMVLAFKAKNCPAIKWEEK